MLSWSSCYSFPSLLLKLSIGEAVVQQLVGKWLYKQGNSSFWESTIIIPFPSPFPLSQKRWYQSGFHDFLRKKRQTHCVRSLKGVYSKLITNSLKQSRKLYSVFQETRRRGMTSYFSLCIGVFVTNVDWHPICVIGFSSVTITSFRSRTVFILSVLYLAVQFSTYAETPVNVNECPLGCNEYCPHSSKHLFRKQTEQASGDVQGHYPLCRCFGPLSR